jgi:hypothetical protein
MHLLRGEPPLDGVVNYPSTCLSEKVARQFPGDCDHCQPRLLQVAIDAKHSFNSPHTRRYHGGYTYSHHRGRFTTAGVVPVGGVGREFELRGGYVSNANLQEVSNHALSDEGAVVQTRLWIHEFCLQLDM